MRAQAIDSLAAWPADVVTPGGVLTLTGYGLDVRVWRGRLRIADGIGRQRRTAIVHRATGGLKRLVVLGHTGAITFDAIRWLADIGTGFIQIDEDGRVLAAFGPQGTDRPGLRRAQARAIDTPVGLDLARELIARKIARQAEILPDLRKWIEVDPRVDKGFEVAKGRLRIATNRDEVRQAEALAAAACWSAWSPLELRWARRDAERVPDHWRRFGSRASPLTGASRLAANPANAILNYLYALLEGEATLASRIVGLDPGLGVLHADQLNRDSLSADLMEPVRPLVDRYALRLLTERPMAASDFHETRHGVCRVTPALAQELAATIPEWGQAVGLVAEDVARLLDHGGRSGRAMPTPASGRNRSVMRPRRTPSSSSAQPRIGRGCSQCGRPVEGERRTCSEDCRMASRAAQDRSGFYGAGLQGLRAMRAAGVEPVGPQARKRIASRQRERQREENEWNASHHERSDPTMFQRDVLPAIQNVGLDELARRTRLSVSYCGRIRRGLEIPHARWWTLLLTPSR